LPTTLLVTINDFGFGIWYDERLRFTTVSLVRITSWLWYDERLRFTTVPLVRITTMVLDYVMMQGLVFFYVIGFEERFWMIRYVSRLSLPTIILATINDFSFGIKNDITGIHYKIVIIHDVRLGICVRYAEWLSLPNVLLVTIQDFSIWYDEDFVLSLFQ
jgi:hypothetical protein